MIEDLMLMLISLSPASFILGIFLGKQHVERLAYNGGESSYPEWVQESVRKYREDKGLNEVEYDF